MAWEKGQRGCLCVLLEQMVACKCRRPDTITLEALSSPMVFPGESSNQNQRLVMVGKHPPVCPALLGRTCKNLPLWFDNFHLLPCFTLVGAYRWHLLFILNSKFSLDFPRSCLLLSLLLFSVFIRLCLFHWSILPSGILIMYEGRIFVICFTVSRSHLPPEWLYTPTESLTIYWTPAALFFRICHNAVIGFVCFFYLISNLCGFGITGAIALIKSFVSSRDWQQNT